MEYGEEKLKHKNDEEFYKGDVVKEIENIPFTFRMMRERKGMSQQELADEMHLSRSNISRIESGKIKLAIAEAVKWARTTDSQDMLVALVCGTDLPGAMQMLSDLSSTAGIILLTLGGII